jgi:hypothetical protein
MFWSTLPLGANVAISAKLPTKLGIASGSVKATDQNFLPGRSVFTVRNAPMTAIMAESIVTISTRSVVFAKTSSVRDDKRMFVILGPTSDARITRYASGNSIERPMITPTMTSGKDIRFAELNNLELTVVRFN